MSSCYIVTFNTHYEAMLCMRSLENHEAVRTGAMSIKLIPVPRELSSSCGTAVKITPASNTAADTFNIGWLADIEHDEFFSLGSDGKYIRIEPA